MKKLILGVILVMGTLSFSSEKDSSLKTNDIFSSLKSEKYQEKNLFKIN